MPVTRAIADISRRVESLSRSEIIYRLKNFKGLKLDFTYEYLNSLSTNKLRHIFHAALTTTIRRT